VRVIIVTDCIKKRKQIYIFFISVTLLLHKV